MNKITKDPKAIQEQLHNQQIIDDEYMKIIEPEIKKRHNLVMPALFMEVHEDEYKIESEDLKKFFSKFGQVEFTNISDRHFYILYKFYFSAVFAFNVIKDVIKTNSLKASVKLLEIEKDKQFKEPSISLCDIAASKIKDISFTSSMEKRIYFNPTQPDLTSTSNKIINFNAFELKPFSLDCSFQSQSMSQIPNIKESINKQNEEQRLKNQSDFTPTSYSNQSIKLNLNSQDYVSIKDRDPIQTSTNNSSPVNNDNDPIKYIANYLVQIENDQDFKVCKRIIGAKGRIMKSIIGNFPSEHKVKIRLRGKGSGYKELDTKVESDELLQLSLSSVVKESFQQACVMIEHLLSKIYKEHEKFSKLNKLQVCTPQSIIMDFQCLTKA